jgi:hypothetical protein
VLRRAVIVGDPQQLELIVTLLAEALPGWIDAT